MKNNYPLCDLQLLQSFNADVLLLQINAMKVLLLLEFTKRNVISKLCLQETDQGVTLASFKSWGRCFPMNTNRKASEEILCAVLMIRTIWRAWIRQNQCTSKIKTLPSLPNEFYLNKRKFSFPSDMHRGVRVSARTKSKTLFSHCSWGEPLPEISEVAQASNHLWINHFPV